MSNTINNLNVTFKKVPNTDSNFKNAVAWSVTINGQTFEYKEGLGHFLNQNHRFFNKMYSETIKNTLINSDGTSFSLYSLMRPDAGYNHNTDRTLFTDRIKIKNMEITITPPAILDVLYCLYSDSKVALLNDFNDFCSEYGYDNDSIKALKAYNACLDIALKFNRLQLDPQELETTFENY